MVNVGKFIGRKYSYSFQIIFIVTLFLIIQLNFAHLVQQADIVSMQKGYPMDINIKYDAHALCVQKTYKDDEKGGNWTSNIYTTLLLFIRCPF